MVVRAGRYELLRPIASGGMAKVHLGRVLGVGGFERLVAVKVMHAHLAEESEFVAMFLDEARLAARIRHPNVVGTIDIQRDEDGYFLVMEYVEGPSLHQVVRTLADKDEGPMPHGVALRVFTDTLAGLHAAHELRDANGEALNLVHRDVSPHNILLGIDGISRLTDFGIARAESRLQATRTGEVKGKVAYMSPEQIRTEPVDRRADIYAAGVVLWEMLTGQRLVATSDDGSLMDRILGAKHPAPRDVRATVPEALSAACAGALAGSAAERPATAALFAEQIEIAATKDGITIASPRVVASFIKSLGLGDPIPQPAASQSGVNAAASDPTKAVRADTGPGAGRASIADSSTDTAVHGPGRDSIFRSSAIPRWLGPSALAAVVAAAVVAFTRGPSASSKAVAAPAGRDTSSVVVATAPVPVATTVTDAPATVGAATASAATANVVVTPIVAMPSGSSSADAKKASPAASAPISAKRRGEGASGAERAGGTFRPRDL